MPLSLAHADGTVLKTDKAALTKVLESYQTVNLNSTNLPNITVTVLDGGVILHEILLQHTRASYGTMVRDLLIKACAFHGEEVHIILDKYKPPSIKDYERELRGAIHQKFVITGPDQAQRQSGATLLINADFKEEFSRFVMSECFKPMYELVIGQKTVYLSHGGKCIKLQNAESLIFHVTEPDHLQAEHEAADTLIAFHMSNILEGNIIVRSSDTDVLVILLGLLGRFSFRGKVILYFGSANHRRFLDVSEIAKELEKRQDGLTDALLGFHALTGSDFTFALIRKGKIMPFKMLEEDSNAIRHLRTLSSNEATP